MADCHDLFQDYLDNIRIKKDKRSSLKTSRDANRDRIRKHFSDVLEKPVPKFHGQGSYMMHSGVVPLAGEYDIDDGVYLQGLGTDPSTWPAASTVHGWIIDATKGYTSSPPESRARCVRVRYAGSYHVDLPCYALNASGVPLLFEKGKSPYESDPRAFSNWFNDKVATDAQIRRLVRYLKGWRDYQGGGARVVTGLGLTILTANHFQANARDDEALVNTAERIRNHLVGWGGIYKPVTPYENLAAGWTAAQRTSLTDKLKTLVDDGRTALAAEKRSAASKTWKGLLGDRFPVVDEAAEAAAAIKSLTESFRRASRVLPSPPWVIRPTHSVRLQASVYRGEPATPESQRVKISDISSDGRTIPSDLWLRFDCCCTLAAGDQVHWQVVNTGSHAESDGGLRGEFQEGSTVRWERSLYTGRHWIECFHVRGGVCIARSGPFYVKIENPEYPA